MSDRPAGAPAPADRPVHRTGRSATPHAGQRRRAVALVLSPLARQIAALGLAFCAVALSLAYPLRGYLEQQAAERAAVAEQHQLEQQIADLKAQQAALQDPAYIKAEAKRRLQYVSPGDTVYVVKVPETASTTAPPAPPGGPAGGGGISGVGGGTAPPGATAGGATAGTAAPASSGAAGAGSGPGDTGGQPWYSSLWDTLAGDGHSAVAPPR